MDLRQLRQQSNIKQKDAASFFGMSCRMYQNYEDDPKYKGTIKYMFMAEKLSLKSPTANNTTVSLDEIVQNCEAVFSKFSVKYCYLLFFNPSQEAKLNGTIELLINEIKNPFALLLIKNALTTNLNKNIVVYSHDKNTDQTIIDEALLNGIKIYAGTLEKYEQYGKDGMPLDMEYLEKDLPMYVQKDIKALLDGLQEENCTHLDCLWCELSGSINSALNDFTITSEQASYLRKKYLGQTDGF